MVREVGIADHCTDLQAAVGEVFYFVEGQMIYIHKLPRRLDIQLHVMDEVGSAGDEANISALLRGVRFRGGSDGLPDYVSARAFENLHAAYCLLVLSLML